MRLFHLSSTQHQQLQPQLGAKRHDGEDPRAVGVPVVWLFSDPAMRSQEPDGSVPEFQHEVDVPDADPDLFLDEPFATSMDGMDKLFGGKSALRWYFLKRPVDVAVVRRWSAPLSDYVP